LFGAGVLAAEFQSNDTNSYQEEFCQNARTEGIGEAWNNTPTGGLSREESGRLVYDAYTNVCPEVKKPISK